MINPDAVMAAQLEWLRSGGKPRSKRRANLEARLVKCIEQLEERERDLTRAFNRWRKTRDEIARTSKTLDKLEE